MSEWLGRGAWHKAKASVFVLFFYWTDGPHIFPQSVFWFFFCGCRSLLFFWCSNLRRPPVRRLVFFIVVMSRDSFSFSILIGWKVLFFPFFSSTNSSRHLTQSIISIHINNPSNERKATLCDDQDQEDQSKKQTKARRKRTNEVVRPNTHTVTAPQQQGPEQGTQGSYPPPSLSLSLRLPTQIQYHTTCVTSSPITTHTTHTTHNTQHTPTHSQKPS